MPTLFALDDTILRKVGRKTPGTAYRKDPLGPAFNLNLVWAQRRIQLSARRLYTRPAYIICTDPDLPLEDILQEYVWRWDIEVNHRDEKTILGVGQAQVRNENSVKYEPDLCSSLFAATG